MARRQSEQAMNSTLRFIMTDNSTVETRATHLSMAYEDDEAIECRLTFDVSYEVYQQIDSQGIFHLEPENRKASAQTFTRNRPITIETLLNVDYIAYFIGHDSSAEAAATHMAELSDDGVAHGLLNPNQWYALYVTQEMDLPPELDDGESVLKAGYATVWVDDLVDNADTSVLDEMKQYFDDRGWSYSDVSGHPAIEIAYQGEYNAFTCIAFANSDYDECSFYSMYPQLINANRRMAVVEYLTRSNYGLPVGNFEFDWESGEIRFKTSLDYEGDRFNLTLWDRLVDVNVHMMDKYAVGLNMIVKEGQSVEKALTLVEGSA